MYEMIFTQIFGCTPTIQRAHTHIYACHFVNVRSCGEAFGKFYASSTSLTQFLCVFCGFAQSLAPFLRATFGCLININFVIIS